MQVGAAEGDDQNDGRDDEQSGDLTAVELFAGSHKVQGTGISH